MIYKDDVSLEEVPLPRDARYGVPLKDILNTYVTLGYYCTNCGLHFALRQALGVERPSATACPECGNAVTITQLTQDSDRLQRELDGARKLSDAQSIILGGAISHLTEPNAANDLIARLQREKEDLQEEVERLRSREMTEERIEAVAFAVAGQLMAYQPIELGATTVVWNAIREAIGETK